MVAQAAFGTFEFEICWVPVPVLSVLDLDGAISNRHTYYTVFVSCP